VGPRAHAASQRFRSVGLNCSYLTKEWLEKMRFREGRIGRAIAEIPGGEQILSVGGYPRDWICKSRFFWNEQYMLQTFLAFNQAFEVLLPTHAVFVRHTEDYKRYVSSCARHEREPISFWMRRRGNSGPGSRH
jgi:hypothetical protein